jgi:transketolase N-terminal domain/subunit
MKSEDQKSLDTVLKSLEEIGVELKRLGDTQITPIEVISTGSLGLDL